MKKLLAIALFTVLAAPAHATITISAMTQLCAFDAAGKETAPSAHASCQSFIAAIVDYHDLLKSVGKGNDSVDFCLPPAMTYSDLQRIVLEYLQKNKTHPDSSAAAAVTLALRDEFSCAPLTPAADPTLILSPDAEMDTMTNEEILNTPAQ